MLELCWVSNPQERRGSAVKLVAEYLERAHQFERLASHETDPKLKADFEKQAQAYYELAGKRAEATGMPLPKGNPSPDVE